MGNGNKSSKYCLEDYPIYLKNCHLCGHTFTGHIPRNRHLLNEHNLTFENYILKTVFNDVRPTCKCGCGKETSFNKATKEAILNDKWFYHFYPNHSQNNINVKEKSYSTNMIRYGHICTLYNENIRNDILKNNIKKYGFENPMKNLNVQNKVKETNIKKYGFEVPTQNIEIWNKVKQTNINKFGCEYTWNNKDIVEKAKQTNLKKYGVENVLSNKDVRNKIKQTNLKKYGVDNPFKSIEVRKKFIIKKSKKEIEVCKILNGESGFWFNGKEYDIKVGNNLFEIDGDYWHISKLNNLIIPHIYTSVNDFNKINDCKQSPYNLYKIFISNLPKEITVENLIQNSYVPNYNLSEDDVIMTKEYLSSYIERNGYKNFKTHLIYFKYFIKIFFKEIYVKDNKIDTFPNDSIIMETLSNMYNSENNFTLDFSYNNFFNVYGTLLEKKMLYD